jgi:hypothetical protein
MKTKSITKVTLLSMFVMSVITAVTLNSCQKEAIKPKTLNNSTKSNSNVDAITASNILMNEINDMVFSSNNKKGLGPQLNGMDSTGCTTFTVDTTVKPYSITFNYGTNCTGSDGRIRSGSVMISYDDKDIRVVNNVFMITFQNYAISSPAHAGGHSVSNVNGSVSLTNTGTNSNGNLVLTQTGGYVATSQGNTDTINFNYSYEWIAGESSTPLTDVQFKITGSANGSFSNGIQSSTTITSPLIKNSKTPGCNYFIQGTTYTIAPDTTKNETIDYGNPGGCSGQMSVTEHGVTTIQNQ